ncbi:MAG: carboxypeptidase-like regulatory domain-containing protein [Algibacter sp.]|uniref:carboxypeptidase-like regulatory domain-containing protein n=1 Tax=Algibacter sp. TaxID=1872428 RepID=UPI00263765C9|nr:carboxypeptidase-like regulatory domain-containing protein [Algibacter sp.]MDG1729965.1 carboxypeptidase-like regulatory domain-containing protein [Algibacter sp.]MDG2177749.1 carboxypeptidase-like regulatory domain-containing protein [Algibacter sp.]
MKKLAFYKYIFTISLFIFNINLVLAQDIDFKEIEAKVIDSETKSPLVFTDIVIENSNISTVTNSEGEFILKIPNNLLEGRITISHLGYEKRELKASSIVNHDKILLTPAITQLNEVNIKTTTQDARSIVEETLKKKSSIYNNNNTLMTAFYRETIKKRRRNASLSEAVVKIHKQPYNNLRRDHIELIKARKNTDYSKLDTIALKLQGGPFSNLYTDIIKYPEFIFTTEDLPLYKFSFGNSTKINDRQIYVVNFKQKKDNGTPLYYGKLYIDAETLALTNAVYSLNVSNRELSSQMYVRKKPRKVDVYPTEATYRVNYRTTNGKWHYAYSNISLTFKVNWKGKLFNSIYTLNSEMAITDWEIYDTKLVKIRSKLIQPSTILSEKASGFSDPRFWGAYNIIEPEKSIESAIKKIQKQLKRT